MLSHITHEKEGYKNTNGFIIRYIPKKQCFKKIDPNLIKNVQNKLNNPPRKTLNYLTPIEYLKDMKIAFENRIHGLKNIV